jgi:hypothetical protein
VIPDLFPALLIVLVVGVCLWLAWRQLYGDETGGQE